MSTCWSHQRGAEAWLTSSLSVHSNAQMHACTYTNTHHSYNLKGRRGNPKQPAVPGPGLFGTVSTQTRSGISVSVKPASGSNTGILRKITIQLSPRSACCFYCCHRLSTDGAEATSSSACRRLKSPTKIIYKGK